MQKPKRDDQLMPGNDDSPTRHRPGPGHNQEEPDSGGVHRGDRREDVVRHYHDVNVVIAGLSGIIGMKESLARIEATLSEVLTRVVDDPAAIRELTERAKAARVKLDKGTKELDEVGQAAEPKATE